MLNILYVEDDDEDREGTASYLREYDFNIIDVDDPLKALEILKKEKIELIISDYNMPNLDGSEFLEEVKKINPFIKFIIISAFGNINKAVKTIKLGADDFIEKPFDPKLLVDKIRHIERNIIEENQIQNIDIAKAESKNMDVPHIIGKSEGLKHILAKIPTVAKTNLPVLILGESGTGKELIADLIQSMSNRSREPFIKVNSAAIPEDLLESELFGYEKGAFTGATSKKIGKFESADQGTIFLDEIGEMPYSMQSKLLRFLQNFEVQRLGSTKPIKVDTRIITATNRDLPELIKERKFREDLYFRLNKVTFKLPSLKERRADIPRLIDYFLDKYSEKHNVKSKILTADVKDMLIKYDYPGNIRELESTIEYITLLSPGEIVYVEDLPLTSAINKGREKAKKVSHNIEDFSGSLKEYTESIEKTIILEYLDKYRWNQSKVAKELGMSEFTLRYRMEKYEIKRK